MTKVNQSKWDHVHQAKDARATRWAGGKNENKKKTLSEIEKYPYPPL